jgi:hypothetical protein
MAFRNACHAVRIAVQTVSAAVRIAVQKACHAVRRALEIVS